MDFPPPWVVGSAIWVAVTGTTSKVTVDFIGKILGPLGTHLGEEFRDWYIARGERVATTAAKAAEMVGQAGREPQPVPGRILFPLLECAANEEEPELQQRWAALLANAAIDGPENRILPAYIEILRQLTPKEAQLVDFMYDNATNLGMGPDDLSWNDNERPEVQRRLSLSNEEYALFVTDLDRLKLITIWRPTTWMGDEEHDQRNQYNVLRITALTIGFVRACRPPRRK